MKNVYIVHGCPAKTEEATNPETRTYGKHIGTDRFPELLEVVLK